MTQVNILGKCKIHVIRKNENIPRIMKQLKTTFEPPNLLLTFRSFQEEKLGDGSLDHHPPRKNDRWISHHTSSVVSSYTFLWNIKAQEAWMPRRLLKNWNAVMNQHSTASRNAISLLLWHTRYYSR